MRLILHTTTASDLESVVIKELFFDVIIFTTSPLNKVVCNGDSFPLISQLTAVSPI